MVSFLARVVLIGVVFSVGCSQKTPVEEISVQTSGVSLGDADMAELAGAWPGWRGPQNNGHAPDQGLPTEWNEATNVLWKTDVPGRGHSSPVIVNDLVLLATADDQNQEQMVVAFNRADGKERWKSVVHSGGFPSKNELHKKGTNANGTIFCDGEHIYVVFLNSQKITATALNLEGKKVWQQELGGF